MLLGEDAAGGGALLLGQQPGEDAAGVLLRAQCGSWSQAGVRPGRSCTVALAAVRDGRALPGEGC
jgi:hypothetical protein